MRKIAIIGGGIAGLAAAHRLQEEISAGAGFDCALLETAGRFGGKIATERVDGFVIEWGPDSFISQKPAAIELCKKLGLGDQLVGTNPGQTKTYVYTGKKLVTMPDGLSLMIPTKFLPFALTPLFSLPGKIRMGLDLLIPKKRGEADESLASFVRRRMGEEALRKMAEPMLAGIYAGDPETMSVQSAFPAFVQTERQYRSLILGMLARKRRTLMQKADGAHQPFSLFMTLKNGLSEMVDAVIEKSPDVSFRANAKVREVAKHDAGWRVILENGETVEAECVIFATPAKLSADFLQPFAPEIAELLHQIQYVSTATATLAYPKKGFTHPLNGFGFVVPRTEGRKILACTWTSSKFPHRTPEGFVMLRCFVGGASNEDLAEQDADAIAAMVKKELADLMGVHQEPQICRVFHNRKSNVQYRIGHAALIDSVQRKLGAFPGLFLTGGAYAGIGIPDCIQNGTRTAEAVINFLAGKPDRLASKSKSQAY